MDLSLSSLANLSPHPHFQPALLTHLPLILQHTTIEGHTQAAALSLVYQLSLDHPGEVCRQIEC